MNLYSLEEPRFHVVAGTKKELGSYVARIRLDAGVQGAVRLLRGDCMKDWQGFYDELAAALQFPLYFGRNWAALDECLADLEWLPSDALAFVFADALSILKGPGQGDADAFLTLLSHVSDDWAKGVAGVGAERKPKPFHVVLHAEPADASTLLTVVRRAAPDEVSEEVLPGGSV